MNSTVKSASRVLDVIELLALTPRPLGVSELSRRLGIPKSSASMLLATLEARGYAAADASRRYQLRDAMREPGAWVGGRYALLIQIARPVMTELVARTGESSFLGVMTPDRRLQYLEKAVSPNEIRFDADTTEPRPLHCTTVGLVLLAFQPQEEIERFICERNLQAFTPSTITDPDILRQTLAEIRRRGYAITYDAHVPGASGTAMPIFEPTGKILAALNVSAPTWRFRKNRERLISELRLAVARAKKALDARAGVRGPQPSEMTTRKRRKSE